MRQQTKPRWKAMRTKDSRYIEKILREAFPNTDAYRYNSASIRVRVIDPRFEGKSHEKRDAIVEPFLDKLPKNIQAQIINLVTLSPREMADSANELANIEFEDPGNSQL
jgi:stress-induced morphogen